MEWIKRHSGIWGAAALVLALAAWLLTRPYLFGQTREGFLFVDPVEPGTPVVMAYMHSAMRTPIEETLLVDEDAHGFILKQLRYRTYGAGLPYSADEGRFSERDGWFVLDEMNRRFPDLSIRNGVINHGSLTVGQTVYHLPELMPLGSELHLYVAPLYKGYWMRKEMR